MMGIAFAVLRTYVLSLVGINLSIFAVLAILLYTDYDIYLDLILIVPDIALPIQVTLGLYFGMALAPWIGYCIVANCFTGLGFFQCFFTVSSVTMWVFSILGLDIIYRDDTFQE